MIRPMSTTPQSLTFELAVDWLDARLGSTVRVAARGPGDSPSGSGVRSFGRLGRADVEVALINPRPARIETWSIGAAGSMFLIEGDYLPGEAESGAGGTACG